MYGSVFSIGYLISTCAFFAALIGAAMPVLELLRISRLRACAFTASLCVLAVVEPHAAAAFMLLPAMLWLFSMRWTAGFMYGVVGAFAIGAVAYGSMAMLAVLPSVGVWCGIVVSALSLLLSYRRIRLGAAFGGVCIAAAASLTMEGLLGVVTPVSPYAYFDLAATVTVAAPVFAAFAQRKRVANEIR